MSTIEMDASGHLYAAQLARVREVRELLDDSEDEKVRLGFKNNQFSHRLNKIMFELSAMTCLVDLMAAPRPQNARIKTLQVRFFGVVIPLFRYNIIQVSEWGRRARRKVWPYVFPVIWIACLLHIGYHLYYKYAYDFYLFRLSRVRWLNETQAAAKTLEREDFLLTKLETYGRILKRIGVVNMRTSFIVQCTYLQIILASISLYFLSWIYFTFRSPFDFYFVRNTLDYAQEQRQNERFVGEQVHQFIGSIRAWSLVLLRSSIRLRDGKTLSPNEAGLIDCATVERSPLARQLEEMLAAGHLRPLNQRPKWVESWLYNYFWISTAFKFYQIGANLETLRLQLKFLDKPPSELVAKELLIYLELLYLLIILSLTISVYGCAMIFTCLDQAALAKKLRKLIGLTIELNTLRFQGRKVFANQSTTNKQLDSKLRWTLASDRAQETQMYRDILLLLMHYRIFLAQLMRFKNGISIIAAGGLHAMFNMPLLSRLHVAYFQIDTMIQMRSLVVMLSCLVVIPADIYLVPVCYLNKRCIDLYTKLNSLLAHVTQISQDSHQFEGHDSHDRHIIISMLRKELAHHDQTSRQLTITYLGFKFTYNNLVRLHVYIGLLIVTMMGENLAQIREATGTIFTDPLGFF